MKEFIVQYWLQIVFGLVIAGFGGLTRKVQKQVEDQRSLRDGTQALLRNEIIHAYDKYTAQEWIPIYGRENISAMYKSYHALGGNGTITDIMDEIKALPSSPPKE